MRFGSPGGASDGRLDSTSACQCGTTSASVGARPQASVSWPSARSQKLSPGRTVTSAATAGAAARVCTGGAACSGSGALVLAASAGAASAEADAAGRAAVAAPCASAMTSVHPASTAWSSSAHTAPSGWVLVRFASQISRHRAPSPRWSAASDHAVSPRPTVTVADLGVGATTSHEASSRSSTCPIPVSGVACGDQKAVYSACAAGGGSNVAAPTGTALPAAVSGPRLIMTVPTR